MTEPGGEEPSGESNGQSPFLPEEDSAPSEPSPWGFRIFVFLAAAYLLYRLGQGVGWVWQRIN
jgi:hypothetical protein